MIEESAIQEVAPKPSLADLKDRLVNHGVLDRWVNERKLGLIPRAPLTNILKDRIAGVGRERAGRAKVAYAFLEDLKFRDKMMQEGEIARKAYIDKIVKRKRDMVSKVWMKNSIDSGSGRPQHYIRRDVSQDPVTGVRVLRTVEYISNGYQGFSIVATEQSQDGSFFGQAYEGNDGSTSLTLRYKGKRYEGADPEIFKDNRFPLAAVEMITAISTLVKQKEAVYFGYGGTERYLAINSDGSLEEGDWGAASTADFLVDTFSGGWAGYGAGDGGNIGSGDLSGDGDDGDGD